MALIDFYEQEIRYFLEESHRFAKAHPEQARALNLEDVRDRDPYAERLIEAFAFLSGSIREHISDDFSELAQELLEAIWPHYAHPLPSPVIMEMIPIAGRILSSQELAKGAVIESGPVSTGLPCRFTTCAPLQVLPIKVKQAEMISRRDGRSALRLTLSPIASDVKWEGASHCSFRFYLHGDPGVAFSLYYMLLKDVAQVLVTSQENGVKKEMELPSSVVSSAVSIPEHDYPLLPYPEHSFPGFRLMEEYFFFPEKLRFVELDIREAIGHSDDDTDVYIDLILSGQEEWLIQPSGNNFKLNCVPAVNLFPWSAEPIHYDGSKLYHRVVADQASDKHYVPHYGIGVTGLRLDTAERYDYPSFLSHKHASRNEEALSYYNIKRREGVDGNPELLLGIVRPDGLGPEILSVDLMCGNDHVVREVKLGDISKPYKNFPDFIQAKNLTVPRMPIWPSFKGEELWMMINCLSLNYMSLNTPERLRNMLLLFDRSHSFSNKRKIEGIESLSLGSTETFINGCPVRGTTMDLVIKEHRFANRGDMLIFSDVLSRVMSMFTPINSFCQLRVKEMDSERAYEWPIKGEQALV